MCAGEICETTHLPSLDSTLTFASHLGQILGWRRRMWAVSQKPRLIQNIKLSYIAQIRLRYCKIETFSSD